MPRIVPKNIFRRIENGELVVTQSNSMTVHLGDFLGFQSAVVHAQFVNTPGEVVVGAEADPERLRSYLLSLGHHRVFFRC